MEIIFRGKGAEKETLNYEKTFANPLGAAQRGQLPPPARTS